MPELMQSFGFQVLVAVTMKDIISWDMAPGSLIRDYRRFGGTYLFHLQELYLLLILDSYLA
jgi:hypothetical protein